MFLILIGYSCIKIRVLLLLLLNGNSFFTAPSTSYEISDIISTLKSGKSLGPNSIPMKILKSLSSLISSPLSQIINESFQSGVFPEKLKLAKVIPLFKKLVH